jgi:hypothetical protein
MKCLTGMVTIVPEGTKPVKIDELRVVEGRCALLSSPNLAFGQTLATAARSRRMAQHRAIPRRRRDRASKFSPRYPFMFG